MNTVTLEDKEALLVTHIKMIKRIAYHISGYLPASMTIDDLTQVGMIGLLEAYKGYDSSRGASFETYAAIRIRGHMLDEIRENDWIPRSVHQHARLIAGAVKRVEDRLGRTAKDAEIAAELDLDLPEYYEMLKDALGYQLEAFEDIDLVDELRMTETRTTYFEPFANLVKDEVKQKLAAIIQGLPEKEQLVLSLYYEQTLNLKEIGQVLGVSESRVCQLHTQAVLRIKARYPK